MNEQLRKDIRHLAQGAYENESYISPHDYIGYLRDGIICFSAEGYDKKDTLHMIRMFQYFHLRTVAETVGDVYHMLRFGEVDTPLVQKWMRRKLFVAEPLYLGVLMGYNELREELKDVADRQWDQVFDKIGL